MEAPCRCGDCTRCRHQAIEAEWVARRGPDPARKAGPYADSKAIIIPRFIILLPFCLPMIFAAHSAASQNAQQVGWTTFYAQLPIVAIAAIKWDAIASRLAGYFDVPGTAIFPMALGCILSVASTEGYGPLDDSIFLLMVTSIPLWLGRGDGLSMLFWGGLATALTIISAVPILLLIGTVALPTIVALWRTAYYHYELRHSAAWHPPALKRVGVFYFVGGTAIVAASNLFPLVP